MIQFDFNADTAFETIRHISGDGTEFWYARELQGVLEYKRWSSFQKVVERAMVSCENSGHAAGDHFQRLQREEPGGKPGPEDFLLSRYACYLIVLNGDPRKKTVALGQTYFAVKTRQRELIENYDRLSEEQKRLAIRRQMIVHNKSLAKAAYAAGVLTDREYSAFQNSGYKGLYGGLGAKEIHARKGLKSGQKILDHMNSAELAANLFRATQTEEKLRRENIHGKNQAMDAHYQVGTAVRHTIEGLGGTLPENLPVPEKSIREIEQDKEKKRLK
ncbi:DNA damage-inducible protein D [Papillibacter cinnamivorans]|uniref:DNA-damage-inducible protein D n=1 Tax=Papillibacter cinnamivorans DSM 12816 TaxID=1122930 RepID=A0A1W2AGV0_9FIRM|nr:DNA damage-inducible protein D [Papillibacter cinnamivorans]SMC59925.1 DNA-damage-inducible protein D [Papillibacter cinnamivorans DSM 12816]